MNKQQLMTYLQEIHWNETPEAIELLCKNEHMIENANISPEKEDKIRNFITKNAKDEAKLWDQCSLKIVRHCRFIESPPHRSCLLLIYVLSGSISIRVNSKLQVVNAGDLLIIPSNTLHSDDACGRDDIAVEFFLTEEYIHTILPLVSENSLLLPYLLCEQQELPCRLFSIGKNQQIFHMIVQILCEHFDPQLCSASVITSMFATMLNLIYRHAYMANDDKELLCLAKDWRDNQVSFVLQYLSNNFASLTLKALAERFGYAPNYLGQLLIQYTGETFSALKQKYALRYACSLLSSSNRSIAEIAAMAGYTNTSFFYKLFKRKLGLSPAEYRSFVQTYKIEKT